MLIKKTDGKYARRKNMNSIVEFNTPNDRISTETN